MDLSSLPAIDHHAHNILDADPAEEDLFVRAFSEAHDRGAVAEVRFTLSYRRGLRDVAGLLGVVATEEAILKRRGELGLEALTRRCLEVSGLEAVLLDDGYLPGRSLPLGWHARFLPTYRVLRIETLAEELIESCPSFEEFEDRFRQIIDQPGEDVIAYKSIACYRTGLTVRTVARDTAREAFAALPRQEKLRLADQRLVDYLLGLTLTASGRTGRPLQMHTGFGDPDLDLRLANPLHLRDVLENRAHRDARLVLLHAGYPFVREAGYLASVYPQVQLDLGLAVPLLSVRGMTEVVGQLLELAPWSKLLYSSDAHLIPEMFYLPALWARRVLGKILEEAVNDGDLSATEADSVAEAVLAGNARQLYGLRRPS